MKTSWNIAAMKKINDFDALIECLKAAAAEHGKLTLIAACAVPGRGCLNLGMMLEGEEEEAEVFIRQVTMVLMPSKYSRCDGDRALREGEFYQED